MTITPPTNPSAPDPYPPKPILLAAAFVPVALEGAEEVAILVNELPLLVVLLVC